MHTVAETTAAIHNGKMGYPGHPIIDFGDSMKKAQRKAPTKGLWFKLKGKNK